VSGAIAEALRLAADPIDPAIADALAPTQTEHGSSRMHAWQRCRREHQLRYVLRVVPAKTAHYFDTGRFTHAALRFVNDGIVRGAPRVGGAWREVLEAARAQRAAAGDELRWDEFDPITEAERLVGAYYAHHGEANGGWPEAFTLLDTEHFVSAYGATARVDLLGRLGDELVCTDTKTRMRALPKDRVEYARSLATREQFLRLSALTQAQHHTATPPPMWVDFIIKKKIPEFDRLLIRFTQQQIDAWVANHEATREAQATEPPAAAPALMNYANCAPEVGSRCSYFDHCHGTPAMRETKFRVLPPDALTPHQEESELESE
jgi:hypothetical protein